MKTLKHISVCIFLFLAFPLISSGQEYASFDYKKGNLATVFPMENFDDEESFLLAFRFPSHVNMVFLDDSLRLKRMQKAGSFPPAIWDKNVLGILNHEGNLYVFMPSEEYLNTIETYLYKFNKKDGSQKVIPLRLNPQQEKELSDTHIKLVKVFLYENRFYRIWVNTQTSKLYVLYYEVGEVNQMGYKTLDLPLEGVGKALGRRKVVPTPIITDQKDVNLITNAKGEKIYMFGDEMLITLEDIKQGKTDLIAINTQSWDLSLESYPVPGFKENEEEQNFNSFIYDGFIYQALYNGEGFHLIKTDFDSGEQVSEKHWLNPEDFMKDFPLRKKKRYRSKELIESEITDPWNWFSRSISFLIQPEESGERLIIGSHIYMDQRGRDILNTLSVISFVGGSMAGAPSFTLLGNGGNFRVTIDPFASINSIIDATYYFSEGRSYQYDSYFDSENFQVSKTDIKPSRWEEVMKKVEEEENKQKLRSVCLFERGDKAYLGYYRKRRYYILEF